MKHPAGCANSPRPTTPIKSALRYFARGINSHGRDQASRVLPAANSSHTLFMYFAGENNRSRGRWKNSLSVGQYTVPLNRGTASATCHTIQHNRTCSIIGVDIATSRWALMILNFLHYNNNQGRIQQVLLAGAGYVSRWAGKTFRKMCFSWKICHYGSIWPIFRILKHFCS